MRISKLIIFCILCCYFRPSAAINVTVHFNVNDSITIEKCDLCVSDTSGVVYFAKLSELSIGFQLQQKGNYAFILSEGPSIVCSQNFIIERDTTLILEQVAKTIALNEVVVTGQSLPKYTATGQIFRLSDKAKKSSDPFRALSEIPLLNVDITGQSIKTNEGDTPLILIDGKYINSGIAPIDPKFIESVELVEVVNAKYLQLGVSKIIDIHLKRDVPLYTFADLRTRHDIPLREGFGAANFELGTSKFAISGSLSGDYLHNDRVDNTILETSGTNNRQIDFSSTSRALGYDGQLLFKWIPKPSEYIAGVIKKKMSYNRKNGEGHGWYNSSDYSTANNSRLDEGGWLTVVYYEHTFHNDSKMSVFTKYNRGQYSEENRRKDDYVTNAHSVNNEYWEFEKSYRNQYTLTIDYNGADYKWGNISGGNNLEFTHDKNYNQTVNPHETANIHLASNYSYLSYSNIWKWLTTMGSVGIQYMHIQTFNGKNSWWKPRVVATIGLRLSKAQNLRLIYNLDNELPLSSQLSTFNHSTNPWLKIEGNPYLIPMEKHTLTIMYDRTFSKFTTRLFAESNLHSNMIEQFITSYGDYSIQSYRNNGSWHNYKAGSVFTFRIPNFRATFKLSYRQEKYNNEQHEGSLELGGNLKWDFGKFFIYSDVAWLQKSYTAISRTKYTNPTTAHVQIAWQATKNLYLSVGLPYFWGVRTENSLINKNAYSCMTETRFKSASLHPWILLSWTIRKNTSQSIEDRMPNY